MTLLQNTQRGFQDYLLHPSGANPIEQQVVSDARADARRRLDIYAEAYRMRLEEALQEDFEALHTLLGDNQFHALCLGYIDAHPSQHPSLRYFGQHMSEFLHQHVLYSKQPVLAELAAFEWAMVNAFDAADSNVITPDDVARIPAGDWASLRFSAHASAQRLEFFWNAPALWSAIHNKETPPAPQRGEKPQAWLVWRQELKIYFRPLSAEEAWSWDAVCAHCNFAEVCAGLCRLLPEQKVPHYAAGLLQRWVSEGLIKSF